MKMLYLVAVVNGQSSKVKRVYSTESGAVWFANELVKQSSPWSSITIWKQELEKDRTPDSLIFRMEGTKPYEGWDQ